MMSDFKERVKKERIELNDKLSKLTEFIYSNDVFKTLSVEQQHLLVKQEEYMTRYREILDQRLWAM